MEIASHGAGKSSSEGESEADAGGLAGGLFSGAGEGLEKFASEEFGDTDTVIDDIDFDVVGGDAVLDVDDATGGGESVLAAILDEVEQGLFEEVRVR